MRTFSLVVLALVALLLATSAAAQQQGQTEHNSKRATSGGGQPRDHRPMDHGRGATRASGSSNVLTRGCSLVCALWVSLSLHLFPSALS